MAALPLEAVTDLYGFDIKISVQAQAVRLQCDGSSARHESAWAPFVERNKLPDKHKLKDMVRKGVPPPLRTWVWMECSGAAARKAAVSANYYAGMAKAGEASPFLKDIDQDLPHTFPNHPWLQQPEGQAALRQVLAAYSVHNDRVGYCRSMNHIVALLLVALNRNQEHAFWLLAALVEDILYAGTYGRDLVGCQVEMKALDELIRIKLPRLHAHLQALEADVSVAATNWYLTLFATAMPSETVARCWDALFNEGPKILFRIALALLQGMEPSLLCCDNAGELFMLVRQGASAMHDRDGLLHTAFDGVGSLPMAVIDRYRDESTGEVEAAVRERRQDPKDTIDEAKQREQVEQHLEGTTLNDLGRQAGVLGKQAASNMKKGFGALMSGVKELGALASAKAQQAQQHLQKTGSFKETAPVGPPPAYSDVVGGEGGGAGTPTARARASAGAPSMQGAPAAAAAAAAAAAPTPATPQAGARAHAAPPAAAEDPDNELL